MLEPETPQQQAAEAAAIRRRWITLGEVLAVAAVLISALTFWNSYQERSGAEADKAAERQARSEKARTLILSARVDGRNLSLAARDPEQAIPGQTIAFPSSLGVKAIDTVDPRIEAGWDRIGREEAPARRTGALRRPAPAGRDHHPLRQRRRELYRHGDLRCRVQGRRRAARHGRGIARPLIG